MNYQTYCIMILSGFASDSEWKIMLSFLLSIISVFSVLVPYWAVFKIIFLIIIYAYTFNSIMV
ncbi:ABC transporter ATP-binding protein, partial [Staphylococcus aureus]|nr:ABC transporter ATP-binding protein [Staphylococcus aureus]